MLHDVVTSGSSCANDQTATQIQIRSLSVNGARLWTTILDSSILGGVPGTTGMNRIALSYSDKAVRDMFVQQAKDIGCKIVIDKIGNIFAILAGRDNTLPPIGMGSHLDTQPNGTKQLGPPRANTNFLHDQ